MTERDRGFELETTASAGLARFKRQSTGDQKQELQTLPNPNLT